MLFKRQIKSKSTIDVDKLNKKFLKQNAALIEKMESKKEVA